MVMKSVWLVLLLSMMTGCTAQVAAPSAPKTENPSVAPAARTVDYAITFTLDSNALQTCETDTNGTLSDRWTVTGSSVQSSIVGSFSLVDGRAVVTHPSEGEDPTQSVSKDVFVTFDEDQVFGTMTLSLLNGANGTDPQCSNTYVISGKVTQ